MKKMLLLLMALVVVCGAWAQKPNLISGAPLSVRLLNAIESNMNGVAAPTAIVDANVTDSEGNILIKRGTPVKLSIDSQHARGVGKAGYININSLSTTAVDGQTIYLMGGMAAYGKQREGLAIGLGAGAGIVVFPFGLFCLCIKGEEAYIPSHTILSNVVIDDNYTINVE